MELTFAGDEDGAAEDADTEGAADAVVEAAAEETMIVESNSEVE